MSNLPSNEVVAPPKVFSSEEKKNLVESSLYELISKQNFYGSVLQEINMSFTEQFPTMAIGYDKKKDSFEIKVNINFLSRFDVKTRAALFYHEILHFTHNHLMRFLKFDMTHKNSMFLMNVAADMAINQYITSLPDDCIDVKKFKTKEGKAFPLLKSFEEYFELLKTTDGSKFLKMPEEGQEQSDQEGDKKGKGKGGTKSDKGSGDPMDGPKTPNEDELHKFKPHDEHLLDDMSEEEIENMLKETKKVLQRTMEKSSYSFDKTPKEIQDLLNQIDVALNGINYKKILKSCIKKSISMTDRENTWNRPSKRYGVYSQGTRCGKVPSLSFLIDTSGSISYTEMNEFLTFVDGLLKVGAKRCTLGLWHTNLYKTMKYKKATDLKEGDIKSGGTDVTETLQFIKDNNHDLNIILTDGYFDNSRVKLDNKDVIWVISKNGTADHPLKHLGKTIQIK